MLHIKLDTNHQEAYEYTMKAVDVILKKVYLQLDAWAIDKDHIDKNIALKITKYEKNTDYV